MPRRFVRLLFRSRNPKSHYKRSFWEDIWPGRPQLRLLLGRFTSRYLPLLSCLFCPSVFQNFENRASGT